MFDPCIWFKLLHCYTTFAKIDFRKFIFSLLSSVTVSARFDESSRGKPQTGQISIDASGVTGRT